MSSNKELAIAKIKEQLASKIYFYSSASNKYAFLSNFYPSQILIDGCIYYHVEGFYQASKFRGDNMEAVNAIRDEINPRVCKQIAYQYNMPEHRRTEWESGIKLSTMKEAVLTKFVSDNHLKLLLLSTYDRELIEDSPTDYYWGCGKDGSGQNMLGKILMEVRTILQNF